MIRRSRPRSLRIARRDAGNPWMRAAVLCSARASAERMLVDLCDDPEVRGSRSASADAEAIVARPACPDRREHETSGHEIERVLDRLAMHANGAGGRELRDGLILALARGARRSGGRLASGTAATSPAHACWRAWSTRRGKQFWRTRLPRQSRVAAIARLGTLDPAGSPAILSSCWNRESRWPCRLPRCGPWPKPIRPKPHDFGPSPARIRAVGSQRRDSNIVDASGLDEGLARGR